MKVSISAEHLLPDLAPLGAAAAGVDADAAFPLVLARCAMRIGGPTTVLANSFVRMLMSELPAYRLEAPPPLLAGAANRDADPFSLAGFVQVNVATVPLAHGALDALDAEAVDKLRWQLDVENRSGRARVVTSDELSLAAPAAKDTELPAHLIMPGVPIALVQPDKTLRLRDIKLIRTHNADDGRVNTAVQARLETHAEEHPHEATHGDPLSANPAEGAEAGNSGFVESPLLADNREHTVHWLIPALPRGDDPRAAAAGMIRRACELMVARCEALAAALDEQLTSAPVDLAALGKHAPAHPLTQSVLDLDLAHVDGVLLGDRACRATFALAFVSHVKRSPVDVNPDIDMITHQIKPDGNVLVRVRHRRDDAREFIAAELEGLAEMYREVMGALS